MRIIGGSRRGRKISGWEEAGIRPMRDFVRTSLFNILADLVSEANFLDLFCGTGSVGLEALSRGASSAVFVDRAPGACKIIRHNLDMLGFLEQGQVEEADFAVGIDRLQQRGQSFDLAFVGPPYGKGLADASLHRLGEGRLLLPAAIVICEVRKGTEIAPSYGRLQVIDQRTYGDNVLFFHRLEEELTLTPFG
ncbi:16S rRNA (guanine(966)-N(2))-methyltransferase RsmD [Candidatus Bipolaricaulota bacterium]|nr:16S rRNA (guanine(966)-N(2))-methyltransferase RsmD [Candidatus Bipolaricaulota bacterium]